MSDLNRWVSDPRTRFVGFVVALCSVVLAVVSVALLGGGALAVFAGVCGVVAVGMALARPYLGQRRAYRLDCEGADDA